MLQLQNKFKLEQVIFKQLKLMIARLLPSDFAFIQKNQAEISHLVELYECLSNLLKATSMLTVFQGVSSNFQIFQIKCPHCEITINNVIRLVAHIFTTHSTSRLIHNFTYQKDEAKLILNIIILSKRRQIKPVPLENLKLCFHDLSDTSNLLNLFEEFSLQAINKGLTFKQKDHQIIQIEGQIQKMINTKKFYHGPSRNFEPITSVQEFQYNSDDEQNYEFEIQNELNSLLNEIWELPQDKEYFWSLWNRTVMEYHSKNHFMVLNYKHLNQILTNVLDQMGDKRVEYRQVIIEHLTALLTYQCLSQREFAQFLQII